MRRQEVMRTLVTGGTILTLDGASGETEALVAEAGRIVGTGSRDEMSSLAGPRARRLDVRGATVLPGLVDAHPHFLHFAALEAPLVRLFEARNHEDIVARIRERAATTPPGEWILCTPVGEPHYFLRRSWRDLEEGRLPERKILDRGTTRHPVLLQAWAPVTPNVCAFNSAGLERVGIGRDTAEVNGHVTVVKDGEGFPTGILSGPVNNYYTDDPFWLAIAAHLPRPTDEVWEQGALEGIRLAHRLGVTSAYEAHAMDLAHIRAYQKVIGSGAAKLRVSTALEISNGAFRPWDYPTVEEIDAQCELGRSIADTTDDLVHVDGVTLVRGGPCWPGYLRMDTPYTGPFGETTQGKTFLPRDFEERVIEFCARHDVRLNMVLGGYLDHDDFLRSLEPYAQRYEIAKRRWVVQHSILIREEHARRYRELGFDLTTSVGFAWGKGDLYAERIGRHVWEDLIPLKRLLDLGLTVACGSDWGPKNPFEQMALAETHEFCGSGHRNLLPGHAVTRSEALATWTVHGARVLKRTDVGSLHSGARADFVVVDRNPLTCPVEDLPATRVLRTVLDGDTVYDTGDL